MIIMHNISLLIFFKLFQAQHNARESETILHCNLSDIFDSLPSDIQCIYDKQTKHLKLKSQHSISPRFYVDVISYVYGTTVDSLKNRSSCNISHTTSLLTIEASSNLYVSMVCFPIYHQQ